MEFLVDVDEEALEDLELLDVAGGSKRGGDGNEPTGSKFLKIQWKEKEMKYRFYPCQFVGVKE